MSRTLVITNDFPPRQGGIESFVHAMAVRFPSDAVAVYTSATPGAGAFDGRLPFPVVRDRARTLLPTKRMTDRAVALAGELDCDSVWFGAAAPLGLMAAALRHRAGVRRLVATTHGHEVWWARTPGTRWALHRIGRDVDAVTYLGSYTQRVIAPALGRTGAARMRKLTPGVDPTVFEPGRSMTSSAERTQIRHLLGLSERQPVVLCAGRLVPRKGQDMLIRALTQVRRSVPGATVLLVGGGPHESRLKRLATAEGVADGVIFAGGRPHEAMPDFFAAADVFAMPCRTRRAGMEVEGLGIVYLEAAAAGLPILVGDSGGAPDTVRDGETGHVVDGRDPAQIAERLVSLLTDKAASAEMGAKGRAWVSEEWTWDRTYDRLTALLKGTQ